MTDRELDAWIAQHVMGWRDCQPNQNSRKWEFTDGDEEPYVKGIGLCPPSQGHSRFSRRQLPYYTTDLNACALAEAKIAEMGRTVGEAYAEEIREIYTEAPDAPNPYKEAAWAGWATAR